MGPVADPQEQLVTAGERERELQRRLVLAELRMEVSITLSLTCSLLGLVLSLYCAHVVCAGIVQVPCHDGAKAGCEWWGHTRDVAHILSLQRGSLCVWHVFPTCCCVSVRVDGVPCGCSAAQRASPQTGLCVTATEDLHTFGFCL